MVLITGGLASGKTKYAASRFGCTITDGASCNFDEIWDAECISHYHQLVERMLAAALDPLEITTRLCSKNPDAIILMTEIGCGIVPIEKNERIRREMCGRCGCILAEQSDEVIRMICGIPQLLKGGASR